VTLPESQLGDAIGWSSNRANLPHVAKPLTRPAKKNLPPKKRSSQPQQMNALSQNRTGVAGLRNQLIAHVLSFQPVSFGAVRCGELD
jgi:hypothetical protein